MSLGHNPSLFRRRVRHGVTLLELMLVMALVVMIAAIALPAVYGSFDRQMLRKAAEKVRVDIAKTRNEAMRSGRIMILQYQTESGEYVIQPWAQQTDLVEGNLTTMATMGSSTSGQTNIAPGSVQPGMPMGSGNATGRSARKLPKKVVFIGASVGQDLRLQTVDPNLAGAAMANAQAPPIVFYPDGTTSNAQIALRNSRNHVVAVQLRGLTGSTQVVEPLPDGTLPPVPGSLPAVMGGPAP